MLCVFFCYSAVTTQNLSGIEQPSPTHVSSYELSPVLLSGILIPESRLKSGNHCLGHAVFITD